MKYVIDIPEKIFIKDDLIHFFGCYSQKLDEVIKNGIPLDYAFKTITDGIKEEADYAYADFDQYKADVLDAEADELPDDDFRYGMERAIEIINAYRKAVEE